MQPIRDENSLQEKSSSFGQVSGVFLLIIVLGFVGWFGMQKRVPEFSAFSLVSSAVCFWLARLGNRDVVLPAMLFGLTGALVWLAPGRPFMGLVCLATIGVYRYGVKKAKFSDLERCCFLFAALP